MTVEINWLGVVFATASSMIVGSAWYARSVFGNAWIKLVKLDEKKMKDGAGRAIAVTLVVSLITAYVLAHVSFIAHSFFQNSFLQDSVSTAFWMWLGFTAARFITHDAFEGRPAKLTALNVTHELVTLLVMGFVIGWLHP